MDTDTDGRGRCLGRAVVALGCVLLLVTLGSHSGGVRARLAQFTAPAAAHRMPHAARRPHARPQPPRHGTGARPPPVPEPLVRDLASKSTPPTAPPRPTRSLWTLQSLRDGLPVYAVTVLLGLAGLCQSRGRAHATSPDLRPPHPAETWAVASAAAAGGAAPAPEPKEGEPAPEAPEGDADASVRHTLFHRLATFFPERSRSLMLILFGQICLWTASYLWFFQTLDLVNLVLPHLPGLEVPFYVLLSLGPAFCLKHRVFEPSLSVALRGLGQISGSVFIRHCLISAIRPLDRAIKFVLVFFASNLVVNAIPKGFYVALPAFWRFLDRSGYTTLGAEQLQEGFKRLSSQTLNVSMFTLFAQYLMKVKSVPKDFVPDDGRPHGPLERYWTALSRGSGPAIVLNIVVNTAIVLAVLPEWLQVLGISGQAIMTFGGVGGLALGLATRDIVANLVSGLLLLLRQPFTIGEEIKSGTRRGTVKEVGWLSTLIEEADGSPTFIPNRAMMQEETVNLTAARTRLMTLELPLKLPRGGSRNCQDFLTSVTTAIKANVALKEVMMGPPLAYLDYTTNPEPMALLKLEVQVDGAKVSYGGLDVLRSKLLITVLDCVRASTDGTWV